MFNFIKRYSLLSSEILNGSVDCHSHILPGVDDGIKLPDKAIAALDFCSRLGIREVIFTPHIMDLYLGNTYDTLLERYGRFKQAYRGEVKIRLGAEYMMDAGFEKHIERGKVLPLFDDHILIECPAMNCPYDFVNRISRVMLSGYFVVLAHPERYSFLDRKKYHYLKNEGVKFQLNLFSLIGVHGEAVRRRAKFLLHDDCYDLWGTDVHSLDHFADYMNRKKFTRNDVLSLQRLRSKMDTILTA